MTAVPFTPEQERKLAEFDAAPQLAESSPMTRAMLALAEELGKHTVEPTNERDAGFIAGLDYAARMIPRTVATVLAADPEPRDAVIERMARAMWESDSSQPWGDVSEYGREFWRRLAASALDASRGGTQ